MMATSRGEFERAFDRPGTIRVQAPDGHVGQVVWASTKRDAPPSEWEPDFVFGTYQVVDDKEHVLLETADCQQMIDQLLVQRWSILRPQGEG